MNEKRYQKVRSLFSRRCFFLCHGRFRRSASTVLSAILIFLFFFVLLSGVPLCGQEVGIRVEGDGEVIITPCGQGVLDFRYLTAGDAGPRTIGLHSAGDDGCVVLAVDAPQSGELTVWVDAPAELIRINEETREREAVATLPFELRFAYANEGYNATHLNTSEARAGAVEIPAGIRSATFPVQRRMNGPPSPPAVTGFAGYQPRKARVYLFFYGAAGPARSGFEVPAGRYEGEIVVHVALNQLNHE